MSEPWKPDAFASWASPRAERAPLRLLGRPPTPLERARAVAEARARGRPLAAIARDLGLSPKQARRYEALASHPPALQRLVEARLLPMAHAQVLADLRVADPEAWSGRCARHGWTAPELKREVLRSLGRRPGGRRRTYLRREKDAVRFYAFRISRSAPTGERKRVIQLLEQAIEFLRS